MGSLTRFQLVRSEDVHGLSGTGIVADGVIFPDGRVAMRWRQGNVGAPSTTTYDSLADVKAIHGHGSKTTIALIDQEYE